jgi:hypothetical protein
VLAGRKAAPAVAAVVCLRILGKLVVVQLPARSAWPRPYGKTARSGGVLCCLSHRPAIMSTGCRRTCRWSLCNRGGAVRSWGRSRSSLLSPFRHVVAARRAPRWQGDRDRDRGPRRRRRGDGRLYKSLQRVVVQIPMACSRIAATHFRAVVTASDVVRNLCVRYNKVRLSQARVTAACNALHPIEARFCRWLLQSADRSASDTVALTQEFLA